MSGLALDDLQACWLVVCKEGCFDGLLNGHGAQLEMDLYGSSEGVRVLIRIKEVIKVADGYAIIL